MLGSVNTLAENLVLNRGTIYLAACKRERQKCPASAAHLAKEQLESGQSCNHCRGSKLGHQVFRPSGFVSD
jgi:hypothetical protein